MALARLLSAMYSSAQSLTHILVNLLMIKAEGLLKN